MGEDAREVCSSFTNWVEEGDDRKTAPAPETGISVQDPGEYYDRYRTAL